MLLLQVSSGLFSDDDIAFAGPLSALVSSDWVSQATNYHKNVGKFVVIGLVVLHLLAIAFYRWGKKNDLVRPMLSGDKQLAHPARSSRDTKTSRIGALVLLLLCATVVSRLVALGG